MALKSRQVICLLATFFWLLMAFVIFFQAARFTLRGNVYICLAVGCFFVALTCALVGAADDNEKGGRK